MGNAVGKAASVSHSASIVLDVQDLSVTFASEHGPLPAVRGLNFTLSAGETLAIVGESGSGKSAAALAIMGLQADNATVEGSVYLHGQQLTALDDDAMSRLRGNSIAMVFQDPMTSLTPLYTVGEQLIEALQVHQTLSVPDARVRAVELLSVVGIPESRTRVDAYPHEFSGGMRQRVLIAMAIANNPDVIIADEPTTALDVTIQSQVLDVLQRACVEANAALLLITHDLGVVARVADRAVVMYTGKAVEQADVRSLFYRPQMPYTIGLLGSLAYGERATSSRLRDIGGSPPSLISLPSGCSFSPRCPLAVQKCLQEEPSLVNVAGEEHRVACWRREDVVQQSMTHADVFHSGASHDVAGAGVDNQYAVTDNTKHDIASPVKRSAEADAPILEMRSVKQHFPLFEGGIFRRRVGVVHAIDGIDLHIAQGETLGLVGESGCGKSTTARSILDLSSPTEGVIKLFGQDVRKISSRVDRMAIRRQLQIVFQDPMSSLDPRMPVYDLIAEPLAVFDYAPAAIGLRVNQLMVLVGLDPQFLERYPQQLSGGQCQRVCIARALALEPQMIILDEPVSALDVSVRAGIVNLLQDLKQTLGLSYLFVAHDLALVRHIGDRVAVMYLGKIVETGDVDDVYENPTHPYTRCLLSAMPVPDPDLERQRERLIPVGEPPGPSDPPSGCRFFARCPKRMQLENDRQVRCETVSPELTPVPSSKALTQDRARTVHTSACHYNDVPWAAGQ